MLDTLPKNNIKKYAISILPDGLHGAFQDGPFDTLQEALEIDGDEGQYIFELDPDQDAKAVGKWSMKKSKWLKRSVKKSY